MRGIFELSLRVLPFNSPGIALAHKALINRRIYQILDVSFAGLLGVNCFRHKCNVLFSDQLGGYDLVLYRACLLLIVEQNQHVKCCAVRILTIFGTLDAPSTGHTAKLGANPGLPAFSQVLRNRFQNPPIRHTLNNQIVGANK